MNSLSQTARRGFTLVELLLATSLMTVIIMLVVSILGTVMTSWGRANSTLEQNSQAALVLDTIGRDLTSGVIRADGTPWFRHSRIMVEGREFSALVFLCSPTDRGRETTGETPALLPGNVSTIAYAVVNINPVKPDAATNKINALCRYLVSPEKTYSSSISAIASATWETTRSAVGSPAVADSKSLLGSNIYGFDLSYSYRDGKGVLVTVPSQSVKDIKFPLVDKSGYTIVAPDYFEVTLTVLSENGALRLDAVKAGNSTEDQATIIAQESRQFSRRFFLPAQGLPLATAIK